MAEDQREVVHQSRLNSLTRFGDVRINEIYSDYNGNNLRALETTEWIMRLANPKLIKPNLQCSSPRFL